MWPLDLPAETLLKAAGQASVPWGVFDPDWYRAAYPHAGFGATPDKALDYYLETGQRIGHSPNMLFDEAWHRAAYPAIAAAIQSGEYASAFDAYCRRGNIDRSPHWLFDEVGYRERYPDLSLKALAANGLVNSYDHYLRHGGQEDRIGHVLFDPLVYLANFDDRDVPSIRRFGVYQHYLTRIGTGAPELPISCYFDPDWYLQRYPDVAAAIRAGVWKCALHHYLCNDTPAAFDPLESFSEAWYLTRDPGLRAAVEAGHFRNGYLHFLQFGARELRQPAESVDLAWYASQPLVRADLDNGRTADAFTHWLTIGRPACLPPADPAAATLAGARPRTWMQNTESALLPATGRFGVAFDCKGEPAVSVVMVLTDGFAAAMATIASLRDTTAGDVELIIADRGSRDEVRAIGDYVTGAHLLRLGRDIGWAQAANAGCQFASAPAVLFLAPGVRLGSGAVARAAARLASDPGIGAVGGMIVQPNGLIAQAGGILWRDGGTHDYQRGELPLSPEANFVRQVDFVSAAFLLVRAGLLAELEGFDQDCAATFYADVDLCARITEAGARVIYDPSAVLFHDDAAVKRTGAGALFISRHAALLSQRFPAGGPVQVFARHAAPTPLRVLFIEDTVPLRRIGSGFVRANDLVRTLGELGCQVTVFPVNGCTHDPARIYGDMPDTAEVMHTRAADRFKAFLADRADYYDVIWIARGHNLDRLHPHLTRYLSDAARRPLVVLDTEAVAPLRDAARHALDQARFDLDAAVNAAFTHAGLCDVVVAVSDKEAAFLCDRHYGPVAVVGHRVEPRPGGRHCADRAGLLFVGAIHTTDSPNLDSLNWFADAVLPLIEAALGWETRLSIAGYTAPGIDLSRFAPHPRITLLGAVTDLAPLYDAHRVFIAPTRYAAGAPYKVFEAASFGVPVVATGLLREQLGWTDGAEILSAGADDPAGFAAAVVALYRDEALWQRIRSGALARIVLDNGPDEFRHAVGRVTGMASKRRDITKEKISKI